MLFHLSLLSMCLLSLAKKDKNKENQNILPLTFKIDNVYNFPNLNVTSTKKMHKNHASQSHHCPWIVCHNELLTCLIEWELHSHIYEGDEFPEGYYRKRLTICLTIPLYMYMYMYIWVHTIYVHICFHNTWIFHNKSI